MNQREYNTKDQPNTHLSLKQCLPDELQTVWASLFGCCGKQNSTERLFLKKKYEGPFVVTDL